jgi:hypothetical protein
VHVRGGRESKSFINWTLHVQNGEVDSKYQPRTQSLFVFKFFCVQNLDLDSWTNDVY